MRYEMMIPDDIERALSQNTPLVLPVGVMEYHSGHCPAGVDGLLVVKAVEMLEKQMDLVILPPFYYGAASFAVSGPLASGTLDISSEAIHLFARSLFDNLLAVGFRNVHVFLHHQTENFEAGMPTDLAFRFAAKQALFSFLEKEKGLGWWGDEKMKDYYSAHSQGEDPFSYIQVHPLMDSAAQAAFPVDHAGEQETSLMMAFCPEGVIAEKIGDENWYARGAAKASLEYGEKARDMILTSMRRLLQR